MTDPNCIFCKIVAGEIPSNGVYEDDQVLAFRDIQPQAPSHLLVIPRAHVASLDAADEGDEALLGRLMLACRTVARAEGLAEGGYRVVTNIGDDGGQAVHHLHLHVLGGRSMGWPPG
jgi:histidine triad (HIT) family protein